MLMMVNAVIQNVIGEGMITTKDIAGDRNHKNADQKTNNPSTLTKKYDCSYLKKMVMMSLYMYKAL